VVARPICETAHMRATTGRPYGFSKNDSAQQRTRHARPYERGTPLKKAANVLLVILLILLTAAVSSILTLGFLAMPDSIVETDPVTAKMDEIGSLLEAYFIDEYDPDALTAAAADGAAAAMVQATGDQWSYYISAAEMESYNEQLYNAYVGIGIMIEMTDEGVKIVSVTEGGPAEAAGLRADDVITEVEGQPISELGLEGTKALIRGEEGTTVRVTVRRGPQVLELDVLRAEIITPVAEAELLEGGIGYITIANFDYHCAEQTLACIEDMLDQGAKALLFDVRFNGGGLKDEMVEILDYLLPEGELFRSVDYEGNEEVDTSDASCLEIPMAVLINEDSYSAAEFFAAALQEYDAAEVVGYPTGGKGNFQYVMDLSDGSAVSISIGKYFTPSGKSLTDVGVTPDVEVDLEYEDYADLYYGELEKEEDEQLQTAIDVLLTKIS